jgi:beta-galactosidase
MKDEDNTLFTERQPGPFVDILGARVEQFYALDKPVPLSGDWANPAVTDGDTIWAEMLGSLHPGTDVLMRYGKSNGWLDDQPAAVTRKVGKGRITYIAAYPDSATMKAAVAWMLSTSGLAAVLPNIPEGVDVAIRSGEGKRVLILTNYNQQPATIPLPSAMQDILAGGTTSSVTLPQYGVAVLETH